MNFWLCYIPVTLNVRCDIYNHYCGASIRVSSFPQSVTWRVSKLSNMEQGYLRSIGIRHEQPLRTPPGIHVLIYLLYVTAQVETKNLFLSSFFLFVNSSPLTHISYQATFPHWLHGSHLQIIYFKAARCILVDGLVGFFSAMCHILFCLKHSAPMNYKIVSTYMFPFLFIFIPGVLGIEAKYTLGPQRPLTLYHIIIRLRGYEVDVLFSSVLLNSAFGLLLFLF